MPEQRPLEVRKQLFQSDDPVFFPPNDRIPIRNFGQLGRKHGLQIVHVVGKIGGVQHS